MSINRFLRNQAFDPKALEAMTLAHHTACQALCLGDGDDRLNELIAKHVIELAGSGVRTPSALYLLTLNEFGHRYPIGSR